MATNDVRTPTITKQMILTRPVLTPMARAARGLPSRGKNVVAEAGLSEYENAQQDDPGHPQYLYRHG